MLSVFLIRTLLNVKWFFNQKDVGLTALKSALGIFRCFSHSAYPELNLQKAFSVWVAMQGQNKGTSQWLMNVKCFVILIKQTFTLQKEQFR